MQRRLKSILALGAASGRSPHSWPCCLGSAWNCRSCGVSTAVASLARELPSIEFPEKGSINPDTYIADAGITECDALDPYPSVVPYAPTVDNAKSFCSARPNCGGFIYTTLAAAQAATSSGGYAVSSAIYCRPRTLAAGAGASSTSGIGFLRHLYGSCDYRIKLATSITSFNGVLSVDRSACVRSGRGVARGGERRASPNPEAGGRARRRAAPAVQVILGGVQYTVATDVFTTVEAAQQASADGTSHAMATDEGVWYYMPGAAHDTREQHSKAFALDGYFPLYHSEVAAKAASIRGGGNGVAHGIGPTMHSPVAQPSKWTLEPHSQVYYMPADVPQLYYGDFVEPFALDGYFPLYLSSADAARASDDGSVQSHGPGAETGHPLSWSNSEHRVYYMPSAGPEQFFGTYNTTSKAVEKGVYETVLRAANRGAGETSMVTAAAQAVLAHGSQSYWTGATSAQYAAPIPTL
eukprot:TRINITY_DN34705_c0_g1_i1.p1 TRINITY_DN34705_c0_g1~~TRINITY_DN34705_c0_g1_i1.p1  ORF type:complete len:467 (+),score=59.97 TRINITY_DN34705_c0_g1_i1:104-1504(+)